MRTYLLVTRFPIIPSCSIKILGKDLFRFPQNSSSSGNGSLIGAKVESWLLEPPHKSIFAGNIPSYDLLLYPIPVELHPAVFVIQSKYSLGPEIWFFVHAGTYSKE